MTFEVPKISQGEHNLYSKNIFMQGVQKKPVSFGGSGLSGKAGGLAKELDMIAFMGAQKADNTHTLGLNGAPSGDEGCGKNLWLYA